MQSLVARILLALLIAIVVAVVLFWIGVALVYVALLGGAVAIVLLILFALAGAAGRRGGAGPA